MMWRYLLVCILSLHNFSIVTIHALWDTCPQPRAPLHGSIRHDGRVGEGAVVYFQCDGGYRLQGFPSASCTCWFDCAWNVRPPTCVHENPPCRAPQQPRNGRYETTDTRFLHGTVLSFHCYSGHVLVGSETITCENGMWSERSPTCAAVLCDNPGAPTNGEINRNFCGFALGDVVNFSCNRGFRRVGPRSIRCQANRTWSDGVPQCNKVNCGNPGVPNHGEVLHPRAPTYDYMSDLVFSCDRKYTLVGSSTITCQDTGEWSAPIPNCEVVTCSIEGGTEHLTFEASLAPVEDGYLVDARLVFSCDAGYRVVGATSVQCTRSGDWTFPFPSCQIKRCSVVPVPANGGRRGDVFTYDSVVSFYCNNGYTLSGNTHLRCMATGQWNGTLPSCTDEGCGVPDSPEHGSVQFHGVTVGSISIFSCDEGYRLIGDSVARCTRSGWDKDVPRCSETHCPNPGGIPNGRREGNAFTVGSEMRFYCDEDYTLVGSSVSVCTTEGRWSHPIPTCQVGECSPLGNPDHGTTTALSLTHGSRVEFTCFKGYSMSGSARTQCNADGSWSDPVPSCNACGIGLYKEEVDRRDCTLCPAGSTTTTTASTSRLQCVCQEGTTGPAGGPCTTVRCDIPDPPDNGLIAECNTNLNGRCSVECSPGYVVRGTRVRTCLNNVWLPESNLPTCHACPVDTYSTGGDRTSCELCPVHSHTAGSTGVTSVNGCVCLPGFRRYYFGGPCQDVDECQINNGGCTGEGAECHNTDGSRTCRCSIPGYTLDDSGMNCIRQRRCGDLNDGPENGRLLCIDNADYNSRRCNIICNDGYYFVSGNSYLTCGPTSNWIYSHQRRNRTATVPGCTEEFFIDTLFNLTVTLEVPANCDSYTGNLPSDYFINTVLQERGDCSDYQCAANQNEISMSCFDTGSDPGMSELTLHFTVYLENPEDESIGENCQQNCQLLQLRSIIQATGQTWIRHQQVFRGELGQVETNSGRLITLSGGEVEASRPDVRCHEEGRVFTDKKLCVPCSKGYYLPGRTEESCHPCPEGTYQDQTGQTSCIPCPGDLTTLEAGSSSVEMCVTQERIDIIMAGLEDDSSTLVRE